MDGVTAITSAKQSSHHSTAVSVGDGTLIADDVVLGHRGKAALLESRSFDGGGQVTIGNRCILRSGTVVYEDVVIGHEVQTAHHVVIREGARVGDGCVFGNGSVVREGATLGRNVRMMEGVVISEGAVVGNDVFIGPQVTFTAGRHMTGAMEAAGIMTRGDAHAQEGRYWNGPSVEVEDEVRIGTHAVILAGVRLGRGCVVAAGAVVSTAVPAGATVAGNPGRIVKRGAAESRSTPAARTTADDTPARKPADAAILGGVHHLGIAVRSIADSLPLYRQLFGATETAPPVTDPIQKVTVCFLSAPAAALTFELIEPAADDSPLNKVLRDGGGAYHVCYEVTDINDALTRLRALKCVVVSGPTPAVAFGGRPIAWLYTATRQLIELVQR